MDSLLGAPYAVLVVALGIIAAAIVYFQKQEKKRTSGLQRFAMMYGYEFRGKVQDLSNVLPPGRDFDFFNTGRRRRSYNVLTRRSREDIAVFDYHYTVGTGRRSRTYRQTVFLVDSERMWLPHFTLGPERFFRKIAETFGHRDIDFDSHPEFSRSYLLQGKDETAIRSLFSHHLRAYFQAHKGWSVEGNGRSLLVYQSRKRIPLTDLARFVNDCSEIFQLFDQNSQSP